MFAKQIVDSDAFLDMPLSAQALYFHLSMRADDDGFVNNPRKIQRMLGASDDDCKLLVAKKFILTFDSGIIVIKHWRIHNYIRGDRKKDTAYPEEMSLLVEKDNGAYTLLSSLPDKCQSSDSQLPDKCQHRLGKDSIGEYRDSIGKESIGECEGEREPNFTPLKSQTVDKSVENSASLLLGSHGNVQLTHKELARLKLLYPAQWERMIEDLSAFMATTGKKYDRHYDIITGWAGGSV